MSVVGGWLVWLDGVAEAGSGERTKYRTGSMRGRSHVPSLRSLQSVADGDFRRAVEIAGAGNHDLFAFLEALQDFDLVDGTRAQGDRRLVGDAVAHDVGVTAAGFIDERTACDGQRVVALVEHDAHRQALVLAQLAGLLAFEAHPRNHF